MAQHSVLVSRIVPAKDALWGLLHDASEAYLADVARPVKYTDTFAGYREAEARLMGAVCQRFGLSPREPFSVRWADDVMLATERRDLMPEHPWPWNYGDVPPVPMMERIEPWPPALAKASFLWRYHELAGGPGTS